MANIILKNGVGQPIEYSGVETIEIPEADATIAPETEFRGFAYDDEFGLYILAVEPSPITFELGEIYRVYWDGTIHLCQAQDLSAMTEGAIGVGNLADFGGTGNGEPFIMVALGGATMCATTDEGESHTVAINKKGGTQIFSAGVATSVTTELNFTDVVEKEIYPEQNLEGFAFSEIWGAHTVVTDAHFDLVLGEKYKVYWDGEWWECETQDAGAVMEGALMLGNGSNFGLSGNNEPFAIGWLGVGITFLSVGSEAPSHTVAVNQFVAGMNITRASEGELISSVAIPKPDTLIPENIAKDVNVAGIVGTHEGGGGGSSDDVRYVTFMNGGVELYVKPVATGDDCVDVLAKGFIETPTKESTAQTDYTYSGWSLTNGGAASNVLGAVTENRTVYAAYTESVRRYTISYYDGDTLLKTESLPYGTIPSYAPAKEGYTFTGWTPAVEPVTCDASYTAIWIEKYDFASLTWDQISEISESGEADKAFELGAKKTFSYKAYGSTYTGVAEIVGFNHDDRADGQGKAGITLRLNGCTDELEGIQSGSNNKSWDTCEGRVKGGVTMYNDYTTKGYGVENALYNVIKPVTKKFYHWANGTMSTITDGLFLPSMTELGYNMANPEGEAYELFATKNKVLGAAYPELISKNNAETARGYWTRTKSGNYHFYTISTAGASASIDQAISGKYARVYYTCI